MSFKDNTETVFETLRLAETINLSTHLMALIKDEILMK